MAFWIGAGIVLTGFVVMGVLFKSSLRDAIQPEVNLEIISSAFSEGGMMPVRYTGNGENISPPLTLGALVPEARSIAITMDDLDFPLGIYNHWVIWNIPVTNDIMEAIPRETIVPSLGNAVQGKSQYGGKHYYRGPLPPFGKHRYIFKVYVLDTVLDLDANSGKLDLQEVMKGHVLQFGTLTGQYGKE